jgi:hypothetical protein
MGPLVEVTSIAPLFRAVYATPDPLYYQTGSGKLIEYAAPTV